jgi:hypothetical protein
MKTLILFCFVALPVILYSQQGVAINNNGSPASASAMLDVQSTNKGMLIPRMTSSLRTSISYTGKWFAGF